jgi:predicted aspartyl protease
MKHTTRIELTNRKDQILAEAGAIKLEDIRRVVVNDAVVDTGATGLALPKPIIEQLGLTPVRSRRAHTTNGIVTRTVYSDVEYSVLGREGIILVTDLPGSLPVLVGHMVLEYLDLCLDIKKGLIYNPAHEGEWIEDQL